MSELLDAAAKARILTGQIHDAVDDWEICGHLPGPVSPASVRKARAAIGWVDETIRTLLAVRDVWAVDVDAAAAVAEPEPVPEGVAQLGLEG